MDAQFCNCTKIDVGYRKPRPVKYGEEHLAGEILAELPPIGSIIEVYEMSYKEDGENKKMLPASGCGYGTSGKLPKQMVVEAYTKGIENVRASNNHMILRCVYPINDGLIGSRVSYPVIQVTYGVLKIVRKDVNSNDKCGGKACEFTSERKKTFADSTFGGR